MKKKKGVLALAFMVVVLITLACSQTRVETPAATIDIPMAIAGTANAAQALTQASTTKTPVVIFPTPTPFQPATPSPYLQVVGKLVYENRQVWVESYFHMAARDPFAQFTDEYIEMRLQINGTTVWRNASNGGELNSPTFGLNDGDIVQIFVDENLVAHLGDLDFDVFVNR